jgi:class III poly(R)-hydroxyalkanoic acid synthase PhaE subunit
VEALFAGIQNLPEAFLKVSQTGWEGFFRTQQKLWEKAGSFGEKTKAYQFEDLDQEAFNVWNDIYENEFKQFLNIPQLGLTRFYQERVSNAVDKFNIFQSRMAEFLHVCYLPMEKSFKVMQDKIQELTDTGDLPDDANEYYRMWIKVLEGHYMTLLKSPEYSKTMAITLDALEDYMMARKDVMQDILKFFPVPTQDDVDDLYREIYLLKKKIKALEKTK